MMTKPELAMRAIETAERIGVNPALVCAIIEVSSAWDAGLSEYSPTPWLMMQDPVDMGGRQRWKAMGTRWGPMQVLGQEAFFAGYKEVEKLHELDANLEAGCKLLKRFLTDHHGDEEKAILTWFGTARRELGRKALAMLPQFEKFVKENPHEKSVAVSADPVLLR